MYICSFLTHGNLPSLPHSQVDYIHMPVSTSRDGMCSSSPCSMLGLSGVTSLRWYMNLYMFHLHRILCLVSPFCIIRIVYVQGDVLPLLLDANASMGSGLHPYIHHDMEQ